MMSLFELPQCIWRDKIIGFFKNVEDLVRLDNAICNRTERKLFLTSISGCKQFGHGSFGNKTGKIRWFALREIIVLFASMRGELSTVDESYFPKLLSNAISIHFAALSLPTVSSFPEWIASKALRTLQIDICDIGDCTGLSCCSTLTSLHISGCRNVADAQFAQGIAGCTQLTECKLLNCAKLRADSVVAMLNHCVSLTSLHLLGYFDLEEVFAHITATLKLTDFVCSEDLEQTVSLSGAAVRAMAQVAPHLTSLELRFVNNSVHDSDIHNLVQRCKLLTEIKFHAFASLTSTALTSIAQYLPTQELYSVDLYGCSGITDAGVITLVQAATNLTKLTLAETSITDDAVRAIGTNCRMLDMLNVEHCTALTDNAFATLNAAHLRILCLCGTQVTGTFATHLLHGDSVLECLLCTTGDNLGADFVHFISETCNITTLVLGPNMLTEAEWLELSTKFPLLHTLIIISVAAVTDAVALSFRAHCPNLVNPRFLGFSVSAEILE